MSAWSDEQCWKAYCDATSSAVVGDLKGEAVIAGRRILDLEAELASRESVAAGNEQNPLRNQDAVAIWITRDFAESFSARSADGRFRITMGLGKPDSRGVHTAHMTRHYDPLPVFAELAEQTALSNRLADILKRTANALKGEPEPLHSHSWHDLPEIAAAMRPVVEAVKRIKRKLEYGASGAVGRDDPSEACEEIDAAIAAVDAYRAQREGK